MRWPCNVAAAAATCLAAGCASIIGQTTQHITIVSTPPGAACRIFRSGVMIAQVPSTPGAIDVRTSAIDLVCVCEKEGYQTVSATNRADVAAATVFSALLWGGTGWAVDSATGTANRYDSNMSLTLAPSR